MALGQSVRTIAFEDAMLYKSFRHLYEKGDTLMIILKDFEQPKGLDDLVLPELQHYFTSFFSNQSSESHEADWRQSESSLGKEARAVKDDAGAEKYFYDMGLRYPQLEPGKYIPFLVRLEERNTTSVITARHSYFTFNFISKKILMRNGVFNQTRTWQDPNIRYQFYELLDYTASMHTESFINWNPLPNQFVLIGQNIRLDLGVGNDGGAYSEVSNDMVDVLFSKGFRRWQKQSLSYAGIKKLPNEVTYVSLSTDSTFPEILSQLDGNLATAIGRSISYTGFDPTIAPVGRIYASFTVNTNGLSKGIVFLTVSNIELNHGIVAVLQLLGGWKPAMRNDKPVALRYNLPLTLYFQ